jgi:probable phosphoglycerate mutase
MERCRGRLTGPTPHPGATERGPTHVRTTPRGLPGAARRDGLDGRQPATGRTDLPLTERGERNAANLGERLRGLAFTRVLVSPLGRARRTCELAGFAAGAELVPDLAEWDYGWYEGRRTVEIRVERPGWYMFRDGCPGGESVADFGDRADRVIARLLEAGGRTLLFGHGHFFRVLAARWIGLTAGDARHFLLSTASLSILNYEHTLDDPAVRLWNDDRHVEP